MGPDRKGRTNESGEERSMQAPGRELQSVAVVCVFVYNIILKPMHPRYGCFLTIFSY